MSRFPRPETGEGLENPMPDVTLFGFPRSVYVQMAGLVLTHKEVQYTFHDLETAMNTPAHLALHPFERVPILRHGDFTLYETAAIVGYVDDVFDGSKLSPNGSQLRARMNQWIGAVNSYYYPYMIYHVSHERNVFPQLGIEPDEKVVEHALPKVEVCLQVMERELADGKEFMLGPQLSLADFYLLPIIRQSNGRALLFALLRRWACIASGIAAGTRQVRSDLRTAAGPIVPVFTSGCITSSLSGGPIRRQGTVERDDGRQELYRAAFIGLKLDASLRHPLALGAFNCRAVARKI